MYYEMKRLTQDFFRVEGDPKSALVRVTDDQDPQGSIVICEDVMDHETFRRVALEELNRLGAQLEQLDQGQEGEMHDCSYDDN